MLFFKPDLVYFLAIQKCNKNSEFQIHGLWTDFDRPEGGFPEYCEDVKFDVNVLEPIRDELETHWPSCYNHKNEWLWKHEFLRHGVCVEHRMSELEYFNNTLRIFHELRPTFDKICNNKRGDCLVPVKHCQLHNNCEKNNFMGLLQWLLL